MTPRARPAMVNRVTPKVLALAPAYFAAEWLADALAAGPGGLGLRIPGGVLIAALLMAPPRTWPPLLAAIFPAGLLCGLMTGRPPALSLSSAAGDALLAVASAALTLRLLGRRPSFMSVKDAVAFTVASPILVSALGAAAWILASTALGPRLAGEAWTLWWAGQALGALVVAPLILTWLPDGRHRFTRSAVVEAALLAAGLAAACWLLFAQRTLPQLEGRSFIAAPFLVWAALRFGPRGATAASAVLVVAGIAGTARGLGTFIVHPDRAAADLVVLAAMLATFTFIALATAGVVREREIALAAASESAERTGLAIEGTAVGLWDWNVKTGALVVNHRWAEIVGQTPESLAPISIQTWQTLCHPDDLARSNALLEEHFRGERPYYECEARMRHRDGHWVWVLDRGKVTERDAAGHPLRMTGTHLDITERRQAEEALRHSEERLSKMIGAAQDAIIMMDPAGNIALWNPAAERIFGYTAEEALGKPLHGLLAPTRIRSASQTGLADFLRAGRGAAIGETLELTGVRRGGEEFPLELSLAPLQMSGEWHAIGIVRDLTERRQAEAALSKSEERYRLLFDSMTSAFALHEIILDETERPADYRFLEVNPAFEAMTGLRAEDIIGRTVLEVLPHTTPRWIERCGKVALTGECIRIEQHSDELGRDFEITAYSPERGRFAVIFQDVTDRRRALEERERLEDQLRQSQKMESVGRLAGGVAHDFNNMLQAILGYADIAIRSLPEDDPVRDDLREIQKAAERSADLTRQLLAFARRQSVSPRVLDLNAAVESALKMLRRLIGEDIELAWLPGHAVGEVLIDPAQIDQILVNLAVNARDAIHGVGQVTITTQSASFDAEHAAHNPECNPGEYAVLTVADTGCGMSPEILAHVFEPFFTTKETGEGTGLGLATVYGIVRQNLGFIEARSSPQRGTTIRVHLPRFTGADGQLAALGVTVTPRGGRETILLAEDEAAVLALVRKTLERLGYSVLSALSPRDALNVAESHPGEIHLLISDVVMPHMNGGELARRIRILRPSIQCLFMSGYPVEVTTMHGLLEDDAPFLPKPFTPEDLATKVREVLDARSPR